MSIKNDNWCGINLSNTSMAWLSNKSFLKIVDEINDNFELKFSKIKFLSEENLIFFGKTESFIK